MVCLDLSGLWDCWAAVVATDVNDAVNRVANRNAVNVVAAINNIVNNGTDDYRNDAQIKHYGRVTLKQDVKKSGRRVFVSPIKF